MSVNVLTNAEIQQMREDFALDVEEYYNDRPGNHKWDSEWIAKVIEKIELYKKNPNHQRLDHDSHDHYVHIYEVKMLDGKKILSVKKNNEESGKVIRVAAIDEYFDILLDAHLKTNHGGRSKMIFYLKDLVYITTTIITLFPKHCKICLNLQGKKRTHKSLIARGYQRGILVIIDMSSTPDRQEHGTFKYILYYQDNTTKFSFLRALTDDTPNAVAETLLEIYLNLGAPEILSTDRGSEFTESVISCLNEIFPDSLILIGKPIIPEELEECEDTINNNIQTWMKENISTKWSIGINFVQYELNNIYDEEIGRTPFEAKFRNHKVKGIVTTGMPTKLIASIKTEKDMKKVEAFRRHRARTARLRRIKKRNNTVMADTKNNTDAQRKACEKEATSTAGPSVEKERAWCWVCGKEDENVTELCCSCNAAIHKACGISKDSNTIKCNICLDEENTQTDEENTQTDEEKTQTDEENTQTDEENTQTDEENTQTDEEKTRIDEYNKITEVLLEPPNMGEAVIKVEKPVTMDVDL